MGKEGGGMSDTSKALADLQLMSDAPLTEHEQAFKQETEAQEKQALEEAVVRLANLNKTKYAVQRKEESKKFGISVKMLDTLVADKRKEQGADTRQGREIEFEEILPDDHPVEGAALVQAIRAIINRYIVLPQGADLTVTLWIIRTYAFDVFGVNPRLALISPEMRCGKTTTLEVLSLLVPKPLLTSNCTPASLFRLIEQSCPTVLIDEFDSFQGEKDELRGILNSGHTCTAAFVTRTVGKDYEPRQFSTWCPMVLALIGKLPDTLEDRSLRIDLQRKKPADTVKPFPRQGEAYRTLQAETAKVKSQCLRWVQDHEDALKNTPVRPLEGLSDRAADNWHSLLAVAALVGEPCVQETITVARATASTVTSEETVKVQLLCDIRDIFSDQNADRLLSKILCDRLAAMQEKPWAEWKQGKPITPNQLARLLKGFGITSQDMRCSGEEKGKGYYKANFEDAWSRYCGENAKEGVSNRDNETTCMNTGENPVFQNETEPFCLVSENGTFANTDVGCRGVPFQKGGEAFSSALFLSEKEYIDVD